RARCRGLQAARARSPQRAEALCSLLATLEHARGDQRTSALLARVWQQAAQSTAVVGHPGVGSLRRARVARGQPCQRRAERQAREHIGERLASRAQPPLCLTQVPALEPLLGRHVREQALPLLALDRDRLKAAGAVPAQQPRQRPRAEAALAVVEDREPLLVRRHPYCRLAITCFTTV